MKDNQLANPQRSESATTPTVKVKSKVEVR